jgi:hypothetical protein
MRASRQIALGLSVVVLLLLRVSTVSLHAQLFTAYEYEEDMYLSLDGTATLYVNSSIPALVALRGIDLDTQPTAPVDIAKIRAWYSSSDTHVTRVTTSRRSGRRFVHLRISVDNVNRLGEVAPFAWSTYHFAPDGKLFAYEQHVGPSAGHRVPDASWSGSEIVAFRLHLPSRITFHNAGAGNLRRGNILVWEQPLADRLRGEPLTLEARMESESILYTTLWLFGFTGLAVALMFAALIWWLVRKKPAQAPARP